MEPGRAHPAQNRPEEIEKPRQYYLPWLRILSVIQDAGPKKAAAMKLFRKRMDENGPYFLENQKREASVVWLR